MDSIVSQTYPIYELIIQDDCSTDDSMRIIYEYKQHYSFIHIYQNDVRLGYTANFLSAINKATGDYIAISDQDDIWELDKIEKQIQSINNSWLSFCPSVPFSDTANVNIDTRVPNFGVERIMYTTTILGHKMLFKKELIDYIPNIDKYSKVFAYDFLIGMTAAVYNKVVYCPETKVNYRRHEEAASYVPSYNYEKSFRNILKSALRTFRFYIKLRPLIKKRMHNVYDFLSEFQNTPKINDALKLAKFHKGTSFLDSINTIRYCIKLRDKIFYTVEDNKILAILRAIYFPISCSDYYRRAFKK